MEARGKLFPLSFWKCRVVVCWKIRWKTSQVKTLEILLYKISIHSTATHSNYTMRYPKQTEHSTSTFRMRYDVTATASLRRPNFTFYFFPHFLQTHTLAITAPRDLIMIIFNSEIFSKTHCYFAWLTCCMTFFNGTYEPLSKVQAMLVCLESQFPAFLKENFRSFLLPLHFYYCCIAIYSQDKKSSSRFVDEIAQSQKSNSAPIRFVMIKAFILWNVL